MGDRVRLIGGSGGGASDPWTPEAPRSTVDTTYSLPTGGTTWTVNDGDDLQAAFNAVQPGDVMVLEAGAEWRGNYTFPAKTGSGDIYIISSALASLPAEGTRVAPSDASNMPRIASPTVAEHVYNSSRPVLQTSQDASNLRFAGIEIGSNYDILDDTQYGVIRVGYPMDYEQPPADNVIFDRCYIHGTSTGNTRDGMVAYMVSRLAVIDSYISDWHTSPVDESHGLHLRTCVVAKVVNNYIEAAGINILIADSTLPSTAPTPADLTITDNYLFKPLSWKQDDPSYAGIPWNVKNHFESKGSERVVFMDNICENTWIDAQAGYSVLWKSTTRHCIDTRIENNININFAIWMTIAAGAGGVIERTLVQNNLGYWTDSNPLKYEMELASGTVGNLRYLQLLHNTIIGKLTPIIDNLRGWINFSGNVATYPQMDWIRVKDNICAHDRYGVKGTNKGTGFLSVDFYCRNYDWDTNVMVEVQAAYQDDYDDATGFVNFHQAAAIANVGFVDVTFDNVPGDFALAGGSSYKNAATDGTDIGVDTSKLPSYS